MSLCVSGCWVDPPASTAFTYTMTNSAKFTGIADFPSGFTSDFDVSVGATSLGTFGPGGSVDFTSFPGGGVSEFVVSGIDPSAGLNEAAAFPLQLTFDSAAATFSMTSEAAPSVPAMGWPAALLLIGLLQSLRFRAESLRRRSGLARHLGLA